MELNESENRGNASHGSFGTDVEDVSSINQEEYFADDEVYDDTDDSASIEQEAMASNTERAKQFLRRMREMGFNRKPTLIVFDRVSNHLHRFDHRNNSMTKMHQLPIVYSVADMISSAVSFGECIYIFASRSLYRLEYGDVTATWTEVSSIDIDPDYADIVASSDAIFFVGDLYATRTSVVYKYKPLLDEWESMKDKPTAVFGSTLLCFKRYLYCFGGFDKPCNPINKVYRMNLATTEWSQLRNMKESRWGASASEFDSKIYLHGGNNGHDDLNSVEMYNPELDQWTNMKPMLEGRFAFGSFWIEENLFSVGRSNIEKFDPVRHEWTIVGRFHEMYLDNSVLVSMST